MPKVSIIIPTYNVEMYLVECMESVVRQTLKDIEIICINDGSTDGSLDILKSYAEKDDRIILIDKENGGYGIGMNIGLDKATGEYVGIVEPDDFVPLYMYEDLYNIAKKNELDFVKADFYRFKRDDETGNMELIYNHLSKNKEDYNVVFDPSHTPSAIAYIMNTWSGIYKRSFLNEFHIRHNETPGASFQDNGFYFQTFVYAKRGMIIDKPYYMNRRDNPNSSVNNPTKVYCMNVEYDFIRDILMRDEEMWERFKYYYTYRKFYNYEGTVKRISDGFKKEYIKRFAAEFKRAKDMGELDESLFPTAASRRLNLLMADPEGYYIKSLAPEYWKLNVALEKNRNKLNVVKAKLEKSKNQYEKSKVKLEKANEELAKKDAEIKKLKVNEKKYSKALSSVSYKIGRFLTFIPRKIVGLFKK